MNLTLEQSTATAQQLDRRRSTRHALCLDANAEIEGHGTSGAVVHELSRSGFLMECKGPLAVGERFFIALPESGARPARTIWACGSLLGCEFEQPLSASACSEALLKARRSKNAKAAHWQISPEANKDGVVGERRLEPRDVAFLVGASAALWAAIAAGAALFA